MSQSLPPLVRLKSPALEIIYARLGLAQNLAKKYALRIINKKYQLPIWQTHEKNLLQLNSAIVGHCDQLAETASIRKEIIPRANSLLCRLRHVTLGNLGKAHPDIVGRLAPAIKGRSGPVAERLNLLWSYVRMESNDIPLAAELATRPFDDIIGKLKKYGAAHLAPLKLTLRQLENKARQLRNEIWIDLKQFVSWSEAEFEPNDSARAEFRKLKQRKNKKPKIRRRSVIS